MTVPDHRESPLSQLDAFFVAYQERAGILMQMAAEAELSGRFQRADVEAALRHVVVRWPPAGQRLRRRVFGLCWSGPPEVRLHTAVGNGAHPTGAADEAAAWRNRPLDPFSEPPFQAWWSSQGDRQRLLFRAHHAFADGELFFAACAEAVRVLAAHAGGAPAPAAAVEERASLPRAIQAGRLLRRGVLPSLVREARRQAAAARAQDCARVALAACAPGDTAVRERRIHGDARRRLERRAAQWGVRVPWVCAAAWARVLHARNVALRAAANPRVSLEVPVSLRAGRPPCLTAGNFISPVVVEGDATAALPSLAREMGRQFRSALRRHAPAAVPLLTWPARHLPWGLFRRLAVTTAATGYATSHFTWIEQPGDVAADLTRVSAGRLRLLRWTAWAPVCLHMGAALLAVADAAALRVLVNYRVTALAEREADALADALVDELGAADAGQEAAAFLPAARGALSAAP